MPNKKRIGFLSYWNWGRGQSYVTLGFVKMLLPKYEVFVFNNGKENCLENTKHGFKEFTDIEKNGPVKVTQLDDYHVPPEVFKKWIKDNKLDAVIFNEYQQWSESKDNLVDVANECGVKTYGYLVWERFQDETVFNYDRIFAPTVSFERFLRKNKVRNFTYVPYSVDLKGEFPDPTKTKVKKDTGKFTFFHPGGWGGVHQRKNSEAVFNAFLMLNRADTKLIMTSQTPISDEIKKIAENATGEIEIIDKELTREELINYYYISDVTVLPSKWETIGIPILESLASGTPVITSNMPPMNEFVRPGLNGYVTEGLPRKWPDITVTGIEVDITKLKINMENIMSPYLFNLLSKNARIISEDIYDLEKNKHYLLDFLKEDLK